MLCSRKSLPNYELIARAVALLLLNFISGCATPGLASIEHEKSVHCRIDNPDRDSWWDTSDANGNGVIDEGETAGPVFDFASLASNLGRNGTSLFSSSPNRTRNLPRASQPANRNGFNAVQINFATPPGYLAGFETYRNVPDTSGFVLLTSGDRISDDLNRNSTSRDSVVYADIESDSAISFIGLGVDFDDLHTFNIGFDQILSVPHTETYGMQISRTHRFTAKPSTPTDKPHYLELAYGTRYLRLNEEFLFDGRGDLLGRTQIDMAYDNTLIGPQVAMNWNQQRRGWSLQGGTTLMLGYNFANASQSAIIGEDLAPGAINRNISTTPTTVVSRRQHEELASIAELTASASYPIYRNVNLQFGYRALYLSELRHAGESINWELPSLGILDRGNNSAWLEGLHASVEWRR